MHFKSFSPAPSLLGGWGPSLGHAPLTWDVSEEHKRREPITEIQSYNKKNHRGVVMKSHNIDLIWWRLKEKKVQFL